MIQSILIGTGLGVAAVAVAPLALSAVGFGSGGVVAGSIAAAMQTPTTAAGSYFALSQSAGVLGMAASTNVTIGTVASGAYFIGKKVVMLGF